MTEPLTDAEIAEIREEAKCHFYADLPVPDLEALVLRAVDELERARVLLRKVEWGRHGGECPACGEMPEGSHVPDCELAALIGK